jgi:hypothetical protein
MRSRPVRQCRGGESERAGGRGSGESPLNLHGAGAVIQPRPALHHTAHAYGRQPTAVENGSAALACAHRFTTSPRALTAVTDV